MEAHHYNVHVKWQAGREGTVTSPEVFEKKSGAGSILVATPPPFPKGLEGMWSPEHFYTAAVSSCLMTTFLAIAENSKLDFVSFECSASGKLEKVENKFLMTEIILEPIVEVREEKDRERALKVLEKSEANCLITNSITAKVHMTPTVKVAENELV